MRANYEEKKRTLMDMFRSVTSQIQSSTQLTSQVYTTFAWAEIGTRTIKQLRMRNIGNKVTNITVGLDDPLLVQDMFLSINRWKSALKERGRPGDKQRYDIKRALDIIKNTIGLLAPCEPESYTRVQKSKYEMMDRCDALNKQDFNAVWGCNNYKEYRSSKPGAIWDKTTGFMKLFRGNDILGRDDEVSFVFKTSFKDKDGKYTRICTSNNTTCIWHIW
jgi:hypothetical protein